MSTFMLAVLVSLIVLAALVLAGVAALPAILIIVGILAAGYLLAHTRRTRQ